MKEIIPFLGSSLLFLFQPFSSQKAETIVCKRLREAAAEKREKVFFQSFYRLLEQAKSF